MEPISGKFYETLFAKIRLKYNDCVYHPGAELVNGMVSFSMAIGHLVERLWEINETEILNTIIEAFLL